jgi:hypothetical protein
LNNLKDDFVIGENVRDLIDFAEKISDDLGLLISPIGWGKTVLIRYVWFYLIGESEKLKSKFIPVYISIDHYKSLFQDLQSQVEIRNTLVDHILRERLIDVVRPFTELDHEPFWEFLKKGTDEFNSLEQYELDMHKIYQSDSIKAEKIFTARRKAREKEDFYFAALKYMREKHDKVPIVLLDNVDTLSIMANKVILDEALRLAKLFRIKVLISMRNSTYKKISEQRESTVRAHPPIRIKLENVDVNEYLEYKTKAIKHNIQSANPRFEYVSYRGTARITFREAVKVYDAMLDMLLGEESSNVLAHVTYFNLRKINTLLLKYLATGYIDDHRLIQKIILGEITDTQQHQSPLWILLSSIITDNHKTRFSEVGISYQEGIVNLYCNGKFRLNGHSIRIHILNFVKRSGTITIHKIIEDYTKLFPETSANAVKKSVLYAIWRLLSFDLIESPEHYKVASFEKMDRIKTISLTSTGDYYRREFINYYEYLVYMKDDVDFENNTMCIQDCVEVSNLSGRYAEVYKFLRFLYEKERDFLFGLNRLQRQHYIGRFSPPEDNLLFVVAMPVHNMIDFGQERKELLEQNLASYRQLQEEIEQDAKVFRETC